MTDFRSRHIMRRKATMRALRERDRRRAVAVGVVLTGALAAGILSGAYLARSMATARAVSHSTFLAQAEELRTGTVLFVPLEGNVCRQRVIDNATWRMADAGSVACDEAVSWNASAPGQKYFVAVRVDAIRSGFRAK